MGFKDKISEFIDNVVKPTYSNFIAIGSFIYLVTQLIAIFFGIKIVVPEQYRDQTMWIAGSLIIISLGYYWVKSKFKAAVKKTEERIKEAIIAKDEEIKEAIRNLEKPKDPTIFAEKQLTYRDVEFAIYCLIKKISGSNFLVYKDHTRIEFDSEKNIIIGIDRGGAIVGGLLGKGLRLPNTTVAIYWGNPPQTRQGEITSIQSGKNLENINFSKVERVLLVDDAIRTGEAMDSAVGILDSLKKNYNFDYKKVCVLDVEPWAGHPHPTPDFCVYKTEKQKLKLPWDEHWDTMKQNEEFDALCQKHFRQ